MARLAELQHGHVHLEQLRAAGIGRHARAHRVRIGRLHPTLPRVYLVGRPKRDVLGRMMDAALHFKGDALITGPAAAQLWGLLDTTQQLGDDRAIDVLLVGRNAEQPAGVRIHRTRSVARQDIRWRNGIPVTSPARTLLDLAGVMDEWELEAVMSAAFAQRLVRSSQLDDVIARNPYAKGVARLRSLAAEPTSLRDTRSKYERALQRLLREAELPPSETNVVIAGKLVDAYWPDIKLIIEVDGYRYHGSREQFEKDRLRDQHLTATGHRVMRVTARQIDRKPLALIARVSATVATLRHQLATAPQLAPSGNKREG